MGSSASRCGTSASAVEEARGLGELGEPLEPRRPACRPRCTCGGELAGPGAPAATSSSPGRLGVEGLRPPPARGRAGRGACAPGRAATCARPSRRPRAGCRGRGRRAARRRRPRAARRATPPTPSAKRASACASSAMRKPGRTPHSSGRSWRIWAHSAWMVETLARSSTSRAAPTRSRSSSGSASVARARSSRSRRRSFMVVAAFSVKVTAAISSSRAAPARTIASMRSTRSVVLPVPAPASSTRLVAWSRRARSRASSSTGRKRSRDVPQPQVLLQRPVADLDRLAALEQALGPADHGEVAEVAGARLLRRRRRAPRGPRACASRARNSGPSASSGRKATWRPPST